MKPGQQHSLFEDSGEDTRPLADRMRPTSLDEVVGQSHQIGPGKALRSMIEADRTPSMIFWGPPGTGETTLAHIIAKESQRAFFSLSAISSGIKDVRDIIEKSKREQGLFTARNPIIFIDEIHLYADAWVEFVRVFVVAYKEHIAD